MERSRAAARKRGDKYYFTGKRCSRGHVTKRYVASGVCLKCKAHYTKEFRKRERENRKPPKLTRNDKLRLQALARRKHRGQPTYELLSQEHKIQMAEIYAACRALSEITGEQYTVDHIVPINHPHVCGLHAPWNLQILPRKLNQLKGNSLPHEEDCIKL